MFERLGFADAAERIAQHSFDQIERPDRNLSIFVDPEPEIVDELRMENCQPRNSALTLRATSFAQVPLPCAELLRTWLLTSWTLLYRAQSTNARRFSATAANAG